MRRCWPGGDIESTPAPDDRWLALFNTANGSLELQPPQGEIVPVFPPGGAIGPVTWSPDSRTLLAVRPGAAGGPIEIWQVEVEGNLVDAPTRLYQAKIAQDVSPQQIVFGPWSPNSRYALFWEGLLSASILADGLPAAVLEVATGKTSPVADTALLNPHYQSWAPDSSALAITAGGYRSAQVGKWLAVWDAASGQTAPVISQTAQVPGQVNWSPRGDVIAYAAVPAHQTGPAWADTSAFDNPAIAGRRIYLLDPITGQSRRLNPTETFQDGPRWSADGGTLYYVEQQGDQLHLLVADPQTGQAEVIPAASQPLSATVGYYGQFDWAALLGQQPASLGHDLAGSWVITEYRFGGVSALGPAEAAAWLGRTAELGPDSVTFAGDTCQPAEFQAEIVAAETYFLDGYRIPPATLGITSPEVEVIRTACPGTPFAKFIRLTPATLLINQDGVFFVLEKQ